MESHTGLLEAVSAFQAQSSNSSSQSQADRFVSSSFKNLVDQLGVHRIGSSQRALNDVQGFEYVNGTLGDLGQLYHDSFSSKSSLYLPNGISQCFQLFGMLLAGKKVLVQSNLHVSVHTGLQLGGAQVNYVDPHYDEEFDIPLPIQPSQISQYLSQNPEVEAIIVQNPTRAGLSIDLREMKEVVGSRLLIIDESFGSHFYFSQKCSFGALEGGADASITSVVGALGGSFGGVLLNIGKQSKIDKSKIENLFLMIGGGSDPSPLILADVEGCVQSFKDNGESIVEKMIEKTEYIRQALKTFSQFKIFETSELYDFCVQDPCKLLIRYGNLPSKNLFNHLYKSQAFNCLDFPSSQKSLIAQVSALNTDEDIDILIQTLSDINKMSEIELTDKFEVHQNPVATGSYGNLLRKILNKRQIIMDIRDIFASDTTIVASSQSLGKISAETKYDGFSSIPILLQGERINENHVQLLMNRNIKVVDEGSST